MSRLVSFSAAAAGALFAAVAASRCASSPAPQKPAAAPAPSTSSEAVPATKKISADALAGNWLLTVQSGDRKIEGGLHLTVVAGVLAGTWTSSEGREWELEKVELSGDEISWESNSPNGRMRATGKIDGDSMKGTMKRAPRSRGSSGDGGSGSDSSGSSGSSSSDGSSPGDNNDGGSSGYRGGRGHGHGGGGRGGRGGSRSNGSVTWTAYKSSVPQPVEAPGAKPPPPGPTPGAR